MPKGSLLTTKVVVEKGYESLVERHYGKFTGKRLELSLVEALYLVEQKKLAITPKRSFRKLLEHAHKKDKRIHERLAVYRELRSRGLVVKTGFKFGCDFRVYQRGVGVKRGPKAAGEHTKWIVFAVPEDYKCAFQELSRAVRLAHSIRARMLWGIVDNEGDVTFFEVTRIKP